MRSIGGVFMMLGVLAALSTPAISAAQENPPTYQKMDYALYTGGFKVMSAFLEVAEDNPEEYNIAIKAETDGLISLITTWKGTIETQGQFTENREKQPITHSSVSIWPDNTQTKKLVWDENGTLEDFILKEQDTNTTITDINRDLAEDSTDIMTAALSIMQEVTKHGNCDTQSTVFDGKRRFTLTSVNKGREELLASRYNRFQGPALKCELRITPQGGDWHKKLRGWMAIHNQGDEAGAAPVIWLARLDPKAPAVPVKMRAKTPRGTFMMHLQGYETR